MKINFFIYVSNDLLMVLLLFPKLSKSLNEQKKFWMLYDSNLCKEYKTLKAFLSTLFEF